MESTQSSNDKKYWGVKEVAEYLGWDERTIYNKVSAREIPHYKVGGSLRFIKEEIDAWVQTQKVEPEEK